MIDKKNSTNMRINNEKGYKIVADNLGEYSIFRADDTIVSTEIQDKIFAESVLDELNALHEENEQLKAQLKKGEDVCSICKHEYLTPSGDYFIGKCEKGHEECSKEDIKYCEDFELKGEMNEV